MGDIFMGVDPGSTYQNPTAIVVIDVLGQIIAWKVISPSRKDDIDNRIHYITKEFDKFLKEIKNNKAKAICGIEVPHLRYNVKTFGVLYRVYGALEGACVLNNTYVLSAQPHAVRKFIGGPHKGKEPFTDKVKDKLPSDVLLSWEKTRYIQHLCDAYAIALYAMHNAKKK